MSNAKLGKLPPARRQELQKRGLHQLREAVWQMRQVKDIEQVLSAIGTVLGASGITYLAYAINLVDQSRGELPIQVYLHDPDGRQFLAALESDRTEARIIVESWKTRAVLYRPDLARENRYGEHLQPQPQHQPVRCAIDIPFSQGTLALASEWPRAYHGKEISFLQEVAQVLEEGFLRLEDLRAIERALRREQALGRIRDQIIALRCLEEVPEEMEKSWVEELRVLGIPINRTSFQFPSAREGYFSSYLDAFSKEAQATDNRLADYPWVGEAWAGAQPVIVGPPRLDQASFRSPVRSLIEVPLPGGGSLGVSSLQEQAFDEEAVQTLQQVAGLLSLGIERLKEIEALRQAEQSLRVEVAMQRVRNQILKMEDERDWGSMVLIFYNELQHLIEFDDCSLNLVDLQRGQMRLFIVDKSYDVVPRTAPLPLVVRKAVEEGINVYRSNRSDPLFGENLGSQINSVLDVPFSGGTVAINSTREDAFDSRAIQLLERFAQVLSEAHRRLEDLKNLSQQEAQLHQAQRLEAIGQLATGVAHEINNPLTSVLGYSELLLRRPLEPEVRAHLETIHQEGHRAREIAARLLQFVRRQKAGTQSLSLNLIVQEVIALVRQQFELDHVRLSADLAEDLPQQELHSGQMQQLLLALLHNSREAIQKTGKTGEIKVQTRQQGTWVRLVVEDDGPGIPEQVRERIFEPFFTTKAVGKGTGTGMGLSLCFAIAREHGGRLWAAPRPTGACLVLELPARSGAGESITEEATRDAR